MSNVAPERMPDVMPMPKAEPVEAQGIEADSGHVNKNQAYPDGMIPGYERLGKKHAMPIKNGDTTMHTAKEARGALSKPKAKAAAHKHPVKRSAKHK